MISTSFENANAKVLVWEITESETELISLLDNFSVYAAEYALLKNSKRRIEFLVVRIVLNLLTKEQSEIIYDKNGKPFIRNSSIQMSVTHSGSWVAVIIHPSFVVGIDIECHTSRFNALYTRFLTLKEQSELYSPQNIRKVEIAWSAKEALYKIIGSDAVSFDKDLEIQNFELAPKGDFVGVHIPKGKEYRLYYTSNDFFNIVYCIAQ